MSAEPRGVKHDAGKDQWDLLPWDVLPLVVRGLMGGARVHGAHNWEQGISRERLFNATQRHLTAWFLGEWLNTEEDNDPPLPHLAHVVCNCLFALALGVRKRKRAVALSALADAEEDECVREISLAEAVAATDLADRCPDGSELPDPQH